jgi:hypothetical protein
MHLERRIANGVLVFSTRLGGDVGWFTTDSTWHQITGMMISLDSILTNGKIEPPVTALANDVLLRSNVDRVSIQTSLPTMPIGHFHELTFP